MKEEFILILTIILLLGAAGAAGFLVRSAIEFRKRLEGLNEQANDKIAKLTVREAQLEELIVKVERLQGDVAGLRIGQGGRF